jgi:hypothetical protein
VGGGWIEEVGVEMKWAEWAWARGGEGKTSPGRRYERVSCGSRINSADEEGASTRKEEKVRGMG